MIPVRGDHSTQLPALLSNAETCKYMGDLSDLIPRIEQAFCDFSASDMKNSKEYHNVLLNPLRTTLMPNPDSFYMSMPAYYGRENVFSCKLVSSVKRPLKDGRPSSFASLNAIIALFDSLNGIPLAFMEAEEITAFRTALVSYLAAKHLLPGKISKIAVLGCGCQAASHLQVFISLLKPKAIAFWGKDFAECQTFCDKWKDVCEKKSVLLCPTASVEEACDSAEFITTVTSSQIPILPRNAVSDQCKLICIVGAPTKNAQEAETAVLKDSLALYADSREAASTESGDVINSGREIYAELGEIISGTKTVVKENVNLKANYSVFKSQGVAVVDAVASKFVYDGYLASKK